jgi:predicted phage gp36 major capsid-like protein
VDVEAAERRRDDHRDDEHQLRCGQRDTGAEMRHAVRARDHEAERVEGASQRRRVRDLDDLTSTPGGAAAVAIDRAT